MPDIYFENVHTKSRFKVVSFNREAGTVSLIGKHGVAWEEKYSKDRFEEMGYRPVTGEAQESSPAPPAPSAPPAPPIGAVPPPPAA